MEFGLMPAPSSTIIEDINSMRKLGLASIAFFYCDFRDDQKKDRRGLLSSLLLQLCDQSDSYCTILSNFYSTHRRGTQGPTDNALTQCLKDLLKLPGQAPMYIVLDALDETTKRDRAVTARAIASQGEERDRSAYQEQRQQQQNDAADAKIGRFHSWAFQLHRDSPATTMTFLHGRARRLRDDSNRVRLRGE